MLTMTLTADDQSPSIKPTIERRSQRSLGQYDHVYRWCAIYPDGVELTAASAMDDATAWGNLQAAIYGKMPWASDLQEVQAAYEAVQCLNDPDDLPNRRDVLMGLNRSIVWGHPYNFKLDLGDQTYSGPAALMPVLTLVTEQLVKRNGSIGAAAERLNKLQSRLQSTAILTHPSYIAAQDALMDALAFDALVRHMIGLSDDATTLSTGGVKFTLTDYDAQGAGTNPKFSEQLADAILTDWHQNREDRLSNLEQQLPPFIRRHFPEILDGVDELFAERV